GVLPDNAAGDTQGGRLHFTDEVRRAGKGGGVERLVDVDVVSLHQIENALGDESAGLIVKILSLVLPQHRELHPVNGDEFFLGQVECEGGEGVEFDKSLTTVPVSTESARPVPRRAGGGLPQGDKMTSKAIQAERPITNE